MITPLVQIKKEFEQQKDKIPTISLTVDNLAKFPMEILYYKEQGHNVFLLEYSFETLKLPITRVATKIRGPLFKMLQNYDIVIYVKGFPQCVYERILIKPHQKWYFDHKVKFLMTDFGEDYHEEFQVPHSYLEKFGENELAPLVTNKELAEEYEPEIEGFENTELKDYAYKVLDDYKKDPYYLRKRIVFVKSFPRSNSESYKERFVYYINNRRDDLKETIRLLESLYAIKNIEQYYPYLEKSNEIALSFAVMSNDEMRKSFYFYVGDLSDEELTQLARDLEITFDPAMQPGGIGVDIVDGEKKDVKIYYKYDIATKEKIKEFIKEFPIENKRKLMGILNSCTKPLNRILLDIKVRDGKMVSKRIDISMQFNSFKLHQLAHVLQENLSFLQDKELFTMSFELKMDEPQKTNFYYGLKIPEPEEDFEGQEERLELLG